MRTIIIFLVIVCLMLCYIVNNVRDYINSDREGYKYYLHNNTKIEDIINQAPIENSTKVKVYRATEKYLNCREASGTIGINTRWTRILIDDSSKVDMPKDDILRNPVLRDAFYMTLVHEETHIKAGRKSYIKTIGLLQFIRDICSLRYRKNSIYLKWVDEVFADYGGAKKALDGDCSRIEKAINFKIQNNEAIKDDCKKSNDKIVKNLNKPDTQHPSWEDRKRFLLDIKKDQMRMFGEEELKKDVSDAFLKYINEDPSKPMKKIDLEFSDKVWTYYIKRADLLEKSAKSKTDSDNG